MTAVSTERELFEAWAVTESFNIDRHYDDAGGEYHRVTTRWAWMAWQAARSADTGGARWLPIDSNYLVSDCGLVKDGRGSILGQWKSDQGYMLVRLSSPRRVERVHRLVAKAFIENPIGLDTVNHIDCDRSNNAASNLEWCTQAENLRHSSDLGRMQRDYWTGKRSPNAALTDEQVRAMRTEYTAGGHSLQTIAAKFGVSKRCAGRVINREVYCDVQ